MIYDVVRETSKSHHLGFGLCHGRPQLGALGNSAELSQGDEVEPVVLGPINGTARSATNSYRLHDLHGVFGGV